MKTLAFLLLLVPVSAWAVTIVPPSSSPPIYTAQNWYCQPVAHGPQTCINYGTQGSPEP